MAITILQEPTTPNCSKTNLVYQVSASNANIKSQFQYVMDVYVSGSSDRLARIRQFPNPLAQAVFDPSRVIDDNLEYYNVFAGSYNVGSYDQIKTFNVEFGEEYGTSPSSSVTLYPNITNDIIEVFPGQIDPNNGTSFNFLDSGSAVILSDRPNGVPECVDAQYRIPFYNGTGGSLNATASIDASATTIAVGANTFYSQGTYANPTDGQTLTFTFNGQSIDREFKTACNYPCYNFMFINKYGMWENFSTSKPVRGNVSVSRQNYTQPFVDYGGTGTYDVKRRGQTNFNTSIQEDLTIATDWLNEQAAEWITQMIESDQVYVAVSPNNTTFKPIVITNASYVQNTGRKDQKVFNYDITFRYANQRRGR